MNTDSTSPNQTLASTYDSDALGFFTRLNIRSVVELDRPQIQDPDDDEACYVDPESQFAGISIDVSSPFENDLMEDKPLTEAELNLKVFHVDTIHIQGRGDLITFHHQEGGFTVRDLLGALTNHEWCVRPCPTWTGWIDVDHVYFEGVEARLMPSGVVKLTVRWGS